MSEEADVYRTVEACGKYSFAVRGSEFIGHAAPARGVEEAEAFIEEVRTAHPEASHNVPAYRIRVDDGSLLREYASDEDEPTGSAGKPALRVLKHRELQNVVVVVSRYFGGTELGVGGLVRAYAKASKLAVDAAGVVETVPHDRLSITADYDDSGTIRGIIESEGLNFDAEYAERVYFDVLVPHDDVERVRERLQSATSGRATIQTAGE